MKNNKPDSVQILIWVTIIWMLFVRTGILLGLAYVLWRVRSVLIMVIISVMLAYVLLPVVDLLCRKRLFRMSRRTQRMIMTIIVFIVFFVVVGFAGRLLFSPFEKEAVTLGKSVGDYTAQVNKTLDRANEWYQTLPQKWRDFIGQQDFSSVGSGVATFAKNAIQDTLSWLKNVWEVLLIPVLAFYFVLDSRSLKREFVGMLPPRRMRQALRIIRQVSLILQSYVVGQLILCVIAGVLTGIVLHLLHMPYALVLAVFAGITRAIPVIGPVVSGIPICLLGALQSTPLGVSLLIFVVIMHFAESKFIMPLLIGERMKLHPAVILIALLIGGEFFGLLGMFLAAPVAAIIRELIYFYIVTPRRKQLAAARKPIKTRREVAETESV